MKEKAVGYVAELHKVVDGLVAPLEATHQARLQCRRGCSGCCVDGLTVFEVEAELIRARHAALLEGGEPHPPGRCAFLDEAGACRIYESRPYVCRTQGLPLRWVEETDTGAVVENRDICPLNADGEPALEALPAAECWSIGPVEERLRAVQEKLDGGEGRRVALRSLLKREQATFRRTEK